ncbi:MAG: Double zinc ribbon [Methanomassiliicoccales archaeon PtaU1.Bin124]|nr:MAG: Double zinc ribbon [Methanomassiliicoccales archaeon PtaU1.Bin124]
MLAGQSQDKSDNDFEFECPECGTQIHGNVDKCPKCGVEFEIEEVLEAECPECGKTVPVDAAQCPACGAVFETGQQEERPAEAEPEPAPVAEDEDLKRQFPVLVSEVKPLMELAKEYDVESSECRGLIDRAVKAGKAKDLSTAVNCVKQCNALIRTKIEDRIAKDIEYLEKLSTVARAMGTDPGEIKDSIESTKNRLAQKDYEGALKEAKAGRKISEKVTGKYLEAHDMCEELEAMIQNAERFYVDTREPRRLLKEAQDAGEHGDWSMMGILARKGKEEISKTLPDITKNEIKKAKSQLMDAKAEGKDVTTLVKVLKDAGLSVKKEKYDEALEFLIEFKAEIKRL